MYQCSSQSSELNSCQQFSEYISPIILRRDIFDVKFLKLIHLPKKFYSNIHMCLVRRRPFVESILQLLRAGVLSPIIIKSVEDSIVVTPNSTNMGCIHRISHCQRKLYIFCLSRRQCNNCASVSFGRRRHRRPPIKNDKSPQGLP